MLELKTAMHTITTLAGSAWTVLDVHLLKPNHLDVLPGQPDVVCTDDSLLEGPRWLEYPFRKSHPIIRLLPSKFAAWIGENFGQELQIPPKRDVERPEGRVTP